MLHAIFSFEILLTIRQLFFYNRYVQQLLSVLEKNRTILKDKKLKNELNKTLKVACLFENM